MTKSDILTMLKSNLNIISQNQDLTAQLNYMIDGSIAMLETEGITFNTTTTSGVTTYNFDIEQAELITMYAAYLYRKRATNEPMPRMLRWARNNLLMKQKASVVDDT